MGECCVIADPYYTRQQKEAVWRQFPNRDIPYVYQCWGSRRLPGKGYPQSHRAGSATSAAVISLYSLIEWFRFTLQNSAQLDYRNSRNQPHNSSVQQQRARKQVTRAHQHDVGLQVADQRPQRRQQLSEAPSLVPPQPALGQSRGEACATGVAP